MRSLIRSPSRKGRDGLTAKCVGKMIPRQTGMAVVVLRGQEPSSKSCIDLRCMMTFESAPLKVRFPEWTTVTSLVSACFGFYRV